MRKVRLGKSRWLVKATLSARDRANITACLRVETCSTYLTAAGIYDTFIVYLCYICNVVQKVCSKRALVDFQLNVNQSSVVKHQKPETNERSLEYKVGRTFHWSPFFSPYWKEHFVSEDRLGCGTITNSSKSQGPSTAQIVLLSLLRFPICWKVVIISFNSLFSVSFNTLNIFIIL